MQTLLFHQNYDTPFRSVLRTSVFPSNVFKQSFLYLFYFFVSVLSLKEVSIAETMKSWQIAAPYTLSSDVRAQDIVCNETQLTIQAEVTGQVYLSNCDVIIGSQSLLHHGLTVSGGHVMIEKGATIFGDVTQIGGSLSLPPNSKVHGVVRRYRQSNDTPEPVRETTKRYLTFDRIVPNDIEHLNRVTQELQLQKTYTLRRTPLERFHIPKVLDFSLNPSQVSFSQKWSFEKSGITTEFQVLGFTDDTYTDLFWGNILTFTSMQLKHSVQNSLGHGGHWFFRLHNYSIFLWFQGPWLFFAQTQISEDLPASEDSWQQIESAQQDLILWLQNALKNNGSIQSSGDQLILP